MGKLDRGFPTDLEDIAFLVERSFVSLALLEEFVRGAIPAARKYELNPKQMQESLVALWQMLKR